MIYKEVMLAFYGTVNFKLEVTNYYKKGAITFRLGGKTRECRILELAWRCEIYPIEDAISEECNKLISMLPRKIPKVFDH